MHSSDQPERDGFVESVPGVESQLSSSESPQPPAGSPSGVNAGQGETNGVETGEEVTFDTQPIEGRMPNSSYNSRDTLFTWTDITGQSCLLGRG